MSWLVVCLAVPAQVQAASSGQLLKNAAVLNVVYSISRVNSAMQDASNNPMDKNRREAVRSAIAAMPAAIVGLAGEFKSGSLKKEDFPMVQAMLGSFVDVNAADNYKRFMQQPDASLIPRPSANIAHLMKSAPAAGSGDSTTIGFDESVDGGRRVQAGGASVGKDKYAQSPEAAPSKDFDVSRGISSTQASSSATGNATSSRIGFDDSARGAEADIIGEIKDNSSAGQSALVDATADLLSAEGSSLAIDKKDGEKESKDSLDKDFFHKKKKDKKEIRQRRTDAGKVQDVLAAWASKVSHWIIPEAHAEEGGADPAAILLGLAALFASISAIAIAGIQADADQNIAQTQADAQKYMTDRTAQNSERLAKMQQDTALQQAQITAQVAQQNNQGVTQRLNMQLAELRSAREEAAQAETQRLALEKEYNDRRIALAEKQADQQLQLAQANFNAQLTQAGLATGTASAGLSVGATGSSSTTANAISNFDPTTGTSTTASGTTTTSTPVTGLGLAASRGIASVDEEQANQPVQAGSGGSRLLASIGSAAGRGLSSQVFDSVGADQEAEKEEIDPKTGKVRVVKPASRGLLSAVRNRPDAGVAGGSSRTAPVASGDISSFIGTADATQGGFASYNNGTK